MGVCKVDYAGRVRQNSPDRELTIGPEWNLWSRLNEYDLRMKDHMQGLTSCLDTA